MGNSIKPHLEHAQKTGVCNIEKQDLSEVKVPDYFQKKWTREFI